MDRKTVRRTLGLLFSLISVMLCGWTKSFNVISVDLKTTFNLTMTEVEILASASSCSWLFNAVGVYVIDTCGLRACYVIAMAMVTISSITQVITLTYVEYFKNQITLMTLVTFIGAGGHVMAYLPSITWGLLLYPGRNEGKLIAVYLAVQTFGKIFLSGLFEICIKCGFYLRGYFVAEIIIFVSVVAVCSHLHTKSNACSETSISQDNGNHPSAILNNEEQKLCNNQTENREDASLQSENKEMPLNLSVDCEEQQTLSRPDIIFSVFFQGTVVAGALSAACLETYLNNMTDIGEAIGLARRHDTIYLASVCLTIGRLLWGVWLDRVQTLTFRILMMTLGNVSFAVGIMISFWRLNQITIYLISCIVTLGGGSIFSTTFGIIVGKYGRHNFGFMSAYANLFLCSFLIMIQLSIGFIYDTINTDLKQTFCLKCFLPAFQIILVILSLCIILNLLNIVYLNFCPQGNS